MRRRRIALRVHPAATPGMLRTPASTLGAVPMDRQAAPPAIPDHRSIPITALPGRPRPTRHLRAVPTAPAAAPTVRRAVHTARPIAPAVRPVALRILLPWTRIHRAAAMVPQTVRARPGMLRDPREARRDRQAATTDRRAVRRGPRETPTAPPGQTPDHRAAPTARPGPLPNHRAAPTAHREIRPNPPAIRPNPPAARMDRPVPPAARTARPGTRQDPRGALMVHQVARTDPRGARMARLDRRAPRTDPRGARMARLDRRAPRMDPRGAPLALPGMDPPATPPGRGAIHRARTVLRRAEVVPGHRAAASRTRVRSPRCGPLECGPPAPSPCRKTYVLRGQPHGISPRCCGST